MELEASRHPRPFFVVMVTLIAVFFGFQVIGLFVGLLLASPFYDGNLVEMAEALASPGDDPNMKYLFYFIQGCGAILGFIIIPHFILKWSDHSLKRLFQSEFSLQPFLLTAVLVVTFMGVNSLFVEWNENLRLPEFLSGFEKWARDMEDRLKETTAMLTKFDSITQVAVAFIVVAVLPAIGEEIVFRGIIQRELFRGTKNIHVSIWLAALIFSAFHFQLYGFLPRTLLGALFGYLYYWSGNLSVAVLAHFVNNGLLISAMYLQQQGLIDVDIESTEAAPWSTILFSGLITLILLYLFKTFYDKRSTTSSDSLPV